MKSIKLFAGEPVSNFLGRIRAQIKYAIDNTERNELLNIDAPSFINYLVENFTVEPVIFNFDEMSIDDHEKEIPIRSHPMDIAFSGYMSGTLIKRHVITYYVPFSGDRHLLEVQPSSFSSCPKQYYLSDDCVCFDLIDFYNDPSRLKNEEQSFTSYMKSFLSYLQSDIDGFNLNLEDYITKAFNERKENHLKQLNVLDSLGVRVKRKENLPETLAVPIARKKILVKPIANSSAYSPEPVLSGQDYLSVLGAINDLGKAMERLPSLYFQKDEEALRDSFILPLLLNFESASASVTGETFNKKGKTDILIKEGNDNLFVAECKFWRGEVNHQKTIDQLLGYLTWRDSKAAIIYFVDNKNLQPVFNSIEVATPLHRCCVKAKDKKSESWFNYHFTMLEDKTRGVELAILAFHFPK